MDTYLHFMGDHFKLFIRLFFGIAVAVVLVFIYAALFARNLPEKITVWFFGGLSGERITLPKKDDAKTPLSGWLTFAFVAAVPIVGWIVFELFFASHFK